MSRATRSAVTSLFAVVAVIAVLAPPAQASERGGIAWSVTKGNAETLVTVYTETGCQFPATKVRAELFGEGMPAEGQVVFSPSTADFSTTGPMVLPLSNAFVVYAERNATALVGRYTLKVQCIDRLGAKVIDEFVATMKWSTPGGLLKNIEKATYTATNTAPASLVKTTSRDQSQGAVPIPQGQPTTASTISPSVEPSPKESVGEGSGEPAAPSTSQKQTVDSPANSSSGFPFLAVMLILAAGMLLLAFRLVMKTKRGSSGGENT